MPVSEAWDFHGSLEPTEWEGTGHNLGSLESGCKGLQKIKGLSPFTSKPRMLIRVLPAWEGRENQES